MTILSICNCANAFQSITTNGLYRTQQRKHTKQLLSPNDVLSQVKESISSVDISRLDQLSKLNLDNFELNQFSPWADTITSSLPKESVWILPMIGVFSVLYALSFPKDNFRRGYDPYERGKYDPFVAKAYYAKHPMLALVRSLQLIRLSNKFVLSILIDKYITKTEEKNRPKRAVDLLELIQKIGPTAIKVGQALSVRPDLIPSEYSNALSSLQDRVPPFPASEAKQMIQEQLGSTSSKFIDIDLDQPVASASIGQVYKATAKLSSGDIKEVAVKIQRPDVMAEIALDLHIVREFAPTYQKITRSSTDLQSLANEWGRGFIGELTYIEEAKATKTFNEEMAKRNLVAITAPIVIDELSTDRVLTTEWVTGTRLDESTAGDVPRLCGLALNAYLVMLLEIGTLHCDPHPGNLMRTNDGKLCILDHGMVLKTDPELQYTLLEFIAHLTSESYDRVPTDLVTLGFLKEEKLQTVIASGFLEPLTYILKQAGQGGGGKKIRERFINEFKEKYPDVEDENELRKLMRADMKEEMERARERASAVTGITMEVEELQRQNADAFGIPEWFLYTSRAFLTLEGISLQADEDFSLIQSCFPYVSRRLIDDDSPRAQIALKDLLYGAGDRIDPERLKDTVAGFSTYTTTTKVIGQSDNLASKHETKENLVDDASLTLAKDSADILLAPEGNLVQDLLVSESATAASAQLKDAFRDVLIDGPERLRSSLPFGAILPKPPSAALEPFLRKSDEEVKAQQLLEQLLSLAPSLPSTETSNGDIQKLIENADLEQLAWVSKQLRENIPKYGPMVGGLGNKFTFTVLQRISDSIELALKEKQGDSIDERIIRASAQGVANAARQGGSALKASRESAPQK